MNWTEHAISKHLAGRFSQLQQKSLGTFTVVDLNEPEEVEDEKPIVRWTQQELAYLVELRRVGKTYAECATLLNRSFIAVSDKWKNRDLWLDEVSNIEHESTQGLDDIARVVCIACSTNKSELISHRRTVYICEARQIFYWLANRFTSFSSVQIGGFVGGRDHSTVLHGIQKINTQFPKFKDRIDFCLFSLGLTLDQEDAA